jgi:predicted DNA-binding transcriptional regulator AlpA
MPQKTKKPLSLADIKQLAVLTVPQFCLLYNISVPTFYRLRERGEAPTCTMVGVKRLISTKEALAWQKRMTEKKTQRNRTAHITSA